MVYMLYYLTIFLVSLSVHASQTGLDVKEETPLLMRRPSSCIISKKKQAIIWYLTSVVFGFATTGMAYCALSDAHNEIKQDTQSTTKLVTEIVMTGVYAVATLFTSYQGYKKGRETQQEQFIEIRSYT